MARRAFEWFCSFWSRQNQGRCANTDESFLESRERRSADTTRKKTLKFNNANRPTEYAGRRHAASRYVSFRLHVRSNWSRIRRRAGTPVECASSFHGSFDPIRKTREIKQYYEHMGGGLKKAHSDPVAVAVASANVWRKTDTGRKRREQLVDITDFPIKTMQSRRTTSERPLDGIWRNEPRASGVRNASQLNDPRIRVPGFDLLEGSGGLHEIWD